MVVRPTILCVYGDRGYEWATRVEQALLDSAVGYLLKERAIQIWVVGARNERAPDSTISILPPDVSALRLRELMDLARGTRQGLEKVESRIAYVFERWSLFDKAGYARAHLRTEMDLALRGDAEPGRAREFELRWISLADSVRPQGSVDGATREQVTACIGSCRQADVTLLVDRSDEAGAPIQAEMADAMLALVALTFISSALVFRSESATEPMWPGVSEDSAGVVLPISAIKFSHVNRKLTRARAAAVLARMRFNRSPSVNDLAIGEAPRLVDLLDEDFRAAAGGKPRPLDMDKRRCRAVSAIIRRALATGDGGALREVALARNRIPDREAAAMPVGLALMPLTPLMWGSAVLGLLLLGAVGVYLYKTRREAAVQRDAAKETEGFPEQDVADVRTEWGTLLDNLASVLRAWRQSFHSTKGVEVNGCWSVDGTPPVTCCLTTDPNSGSVPLDTSIYQEISDECARLLELAVTSGHAPQDVIAEAVFRMVRGTGSLEGELVQAAFRAPHADAPRQVVRASKLSVHVGQIPTPGAVWWFSAAALGLAELLTTIEPPQTSALVQHLDHGNQDCSVRVLLGRPVQWGEVVSLSSILETK